MCFPTTTPGPAAILNGLRREHAHMLGGSMWLWAGTLVVSLGSFVVDELVRVQVPASRTTILQPWTVVERGSLLR